MIAALVSRSTLDPDTAVAMGLAVFLFGVWVGIGRRNRARALDSVLRSFDRLDQ